MTDWLVINAWLLTFSVGTVLVLRRPFARRLGAGAAYALWLVVPVSMLATLPFPEQMPPASVALPLPAWNVPIADAAGEPSAAGWNWQHAVVLLWVLGTAAALACLALQVMAARRLKSSSHPAPTRPITDTTGKQLTPERLRVSHSLHSPVVIGLFRPVLLVPADIRSRLDESSLAMVMDHERVHMRRRDNLVNLAASLVRSLFWFNPLVWAGYRAFRDDQELSCDARVLAHRGRRERARYGQALLALSFPQEAPALATGWTQPHSTQWRIRMLAHHRTTAVRRISGALLVGFVLAATFTVMAATDTTSTSTANSHATEHEVVPLVRVQPRYPADAVEEGIEGQVTIEFTITEDGATENLVVLKADPEGVFESEATAALKAWRFQPPPYWKTSRRPCAPLRR